MLAPVAGADCAVIFPDHHRPGAALAILPSFPFTSAFPASRLLLALIAGGVAYAASDQTDTESGVPQNMGVCKGYEGKTYVRPYKKTLNDPGRVWSDNDKFFLNLISKNVMLINPNITQNPGWDK